MKNRRLRALVGLAFLVTLATAPNVGALQTAEPRPEKVQREIAAAVRRVAQQYGDVRERWIPRHCEWQTVNGKRVLHCQLDIRLLIAF